MLLAYAAVLMAWMNGASLADRFAAARDAVSRMFPSRPRVGRTYQGFIRALRRDGVWLLELLVTRLRAATQGMSQCWTVLGVLAFAADGSRVECPRTAANERVLKRAGRKKTGPQLSLTTMYHMGSGCPWDFRIGPGTESEVVHLRAMLATLPPGATLVADAGFVGYGLLKEVLASGRHVIVRVGSNVRLLRKLGYVRTETDGTVYLWPKGAQKKHQAPLALRMIQLKDGRHPVVVVTDVRSGEKLSDRQVGVLYRMRWGVEVFYRGLKQTLARRKMRSAAPWQARTELEWAVMGLWVLSVMGVQALIAGGQRPDRLSVALALRQVRQAMADRRRRAPRLARRLMTAVKDRYTRVRPKSARQWPHKKNDKPAGAPKVSTATPEQRQHAQELLIQRPAA